MSSYKVIIPNLKKKKEKLGKRIEDRINVMKNKKQNHEMKTELIFKFL